MFRFTFFPLDFFFTIFDIKNAVCLNLHNPFLSEICIKLMIFLEVIFLVVGINIVTKNLLIF